jgi:hypothetical protein
MSERMESFAFNGINGLIAFPAGVRVEIIDLVSCLLTETEGRGYVLHPGWCWGFGCRAIKGLVPAVASNHSWGLALDINAPDNPLGGTSTDMPSWMPDLWNEYGFRWGGDYSGRKDPMHYEFMGTPLDAEAMTVRAREMLVSLTTEQANDLKWVEGFQKYMRGEKEPSKIGPVKRGWNDAKISVEGRPPAH